MRCGHLLLVMGVSLAPGVVSGQTLREVLRGYGVPEGPGAAEYLDHAITSHAVENAADVFLIAYYRLGPDRRALDDTLRVGAYDRGAGTWRHAAAPQGLGGSVVGIRHTDRHVFLDTHVTPSAGELIVLARDLTVVARLEGWLVRLLPGVALYHTSMVHFAPTHPAELWTWSEVTRRDALLYPARPFDTVRARYVETTRRLYDRLGEPWFREHNHNLDPEQFGSRLGDTVVAGAAGADIAFVMHFGEGNGSPADPPPLEVLVTCRGIGTARQACDEADLASLRRDHPGWTTLQLLNDAVGNPPSPPPAARRQAGTLERLTESRVRFRVRPGDPWRYGMLNRTRTEPPCFMVLTFNADRTLRSQVWLDSIVTLHVSETSRSPTWQDWADTTAHAGETWEPVATEVVDAAVRRCRAGAR